jgi:hypothetical protein
MALKTQRKGLRDTITSFLIQAGILEGEAFAVKHGFEKNADRFVAASRVVEILDRAGWVITRKPGAGPVPKDALMDAINALCDARDEAQPTL